MALNPADDGRTLVLRPNSGNWKANLFWITLPAIALTVSVLGPATMEPSERLTSGFVGFVGVGIIGRLLIRNLTLKVVATSEGISYAWLFSRIHVPYSQIAVVESEDYSKTVRESYVTRGSSGFKNYKNAPILAPNRHLVLRDGQRRKLMDLPDDLQPADQASELARRLHGIGEWKKVN